MIFNGNDLSPYLKIKSIKGRGIINNDIYLRDAINMDGAHFQSKKRPLRPIYIEANIIASNRESLRTRIDTLNGLLNVNEPKQIIFSDQPSMEFKGIFAQSGEDEEFPFMHQGQMTIVCPDPNKYGNTHTHLPEEFVDDSITVQNNGTEKAYATVEVLFNADMPDFIITNGLDTLRIIFNFVVGNTLEIDFKKRKVYINNQLNMNIVDLNNPNFFSLTPGYNYIDKSLGTDVTITYRDVFA